MKVFAHSIPQSPDQTRWEPLSHYLSEVGERAAGFASSFGWQNAGRIAGLLHDIGKMSQAYQDYIRRPMDKAGPKGPDHSTPAPGIGEQVRRVPAGQELIRSKPLQSQFAQADPGW